MLYSGNFYAMNCTECNPNVSLYFKECTLRRLLTICSELCGDGGLHVERGVINPSFVTEPWM